MLASESYLWSLWAEQDFLTLIRTSIQQQSTPTLLSSKPLLSHIFQVPAVPHALAEKDCRWIPTLKSLTSFTITLKTPQPPCPPPRKRMELQLCPEPSLHPLSSSWARCSDINPQKSPGHELWTLHDTNAIFTWKTLISLFVMYNLAFFH